MAGRPSRFTSPARVSLDLLAMRPDDRASFFLHVSQQMEHLSESLRRLVPHPVAGWEYAWVDTRQGKLIEIEVTAEV